MSIDNNIPAFAMAINETAREAGHTQFGMTLLDAAALAYFQGLTAAGLAHDGMGKESYDMAAKFLEARKTYIPCP